MQIRTSCSFYVEVPAPGNFSVIAFLFRGKEFLTTFCLGKTNIAVTSAMCVIYFLAKTDEIFLFNLRVKDINMYVVAACCFHLYISTNKYCTYVCIYVISSFLNGISDRKSADVNKFIRVHEWFLGQLDVHSGHSVIVTTKRHLLNAIFSITLTNTSSLFL